MKFYKSLKFKALAGTLLLIIILCAAFIRIIPDYSTSRGFAVVSLPDYNKYKQGYCLKENRILPKEELYKKVGGAYLDNNVKLYQMIDAYRLKTFGSLWSSKYEVTYYELENINLSNCFEILEKYYQEGKTTEEILMKELKAKKTDPKKYLKINLKDTSVGFDRPIVRVDGDDKAIAGTLFLDKFAIFNSNYMQFNHSEYIYDTRENFIIVKKYYKERKNAVVGIGKGFKFDNCGNINYPLEEYYLGGRDIEMR
ncbi:hypothetical protein [uncultured Campylobacter sp.]|uniref:hypothetical protein n=1 Tax=uncultured Campylobacter sp. TaxID=218934 RepID=UPI0026178847|nr:hypothetical protein [uncultured Campylobacter sp.]